MVHPHTVHLPLGALLIGCTMCGTGLGFFGNALESAAYYVVDKALGRLCYLCDDLAEASGRSGRMIHRPSHPRFYGAKHPTPHSLRFHRILPRDGYRISAFLQPLGEAPKHCPTCTTPF